METIAHSHDNLHKTIFTSPLNDNNKRRRDNCSLLSTDILKKTPKNNKTTRYSFSLERRETI